MTGTIKPVLKWVGGKNQILETVLNVFPTTMTNYREPFVGGGSVLLGLLSRVQRGEIVVAEHIYASDLNSSLIGVYQNIQQEPNEVLMEIQTLLEQSGHGSTVNRKPTTLEEAQTSPESYYYWIRRQFNQMSSAEKCTPAGSAMFLFLNKTCFRGMYREGPDGFNVPFGNYKNPSIVDDDHFWAVSELIQPVKFSARSFVDVMEEVELNDFFYLDPPYVPETTKSFVGYNAGGFSDHPVLFECCRRLKERGGKFAMSNAKVPLVEEQFPIDTYEVRSITCRRAINSKNPESTANEVIITNF